MVKEEEKTCKNCTHYNIWDEHCDVYEAVPFVKCEHWEEKL